MLLVVRRTALFRLHRVCAMKVADVTIEVERGGELGPTDAANQQATRSTATTHRAETTNNKAEQRQRNKEGFQQSSKVQAVCTADGKS